MPTPSNVVFYDLPSDQHLPLLAKLASAAWDKRRHLLIRVTPEQAPLADDHLWTFNDAAFIPHEIANAGTPLRDPDLTVALVTTDHNPIGATILVQLAPSTHAFASTFATVIDLVDPTTPERLAASRVRYRAWRDQGITPELRRAV